MILLASLSNRQGGQGVSHAPVKRILWAAFFLVLQFFVWFVFPPLRDVVWECHLCSVCCKPSFPVGSVSVFTAHVPPFTPSPKAAVIAFCCQPGLDPGHNRSVEMENREVLLKTFD